MLTRWLISCVLVLSLSSCFPEDKQISTTKPIDHTAWTMLLEKHVDAEGFVNYKAFQADSLSLNDYLKLLSKNHPNDAFWTEEEQLAYWINAYNAYTIQIVLRHYPLESIRDIAGAIPFVNSVWDVDFIRIEDRVYSLNNIEHGILRSHFKEPRIHFAINCASMSCPQLRGEAYTASKLEKQLGEQVVLFVNDRSKNDFLEDELRLSKIFSWFGGDFEDGQSIPEFLQKYSNVEFSLDADIKFLDYDWRLNSQEL